MTSLRSSGFAAHVSRRDWMTAAGAAVLAAVSSSEHRLMAGPANKVPIVDPHVHVWSHDPKFPFAADQHPPSDDALPSTLLDLMQLHGVAHTVIVHVIYYRWDCRYTAAAVCEHPHRFMGVCRVDPQSAQADTDLDHWISQGFRGVRLSPGAGPEGDWIRDRRQMDKIAVRAAEHQIPLCILCPISRIGDVAQLVERHQDRLDVCIDHMADCPIDQPHELDKLLALARYERVYVKLSHLWSLSKEDYPYRDTYGQVRRLYDAFGPRRLMWGTDWPVVEKYCGYGRALALYRDEIPFFTDEDRRWILGGTALRLWPFDRKA